MVTAHGATAEGGDNNVRVLIDHGSCSGTAHCQQSMPEVFVVVNRKSHVRDDVDWSVIDVGHLAEVAESCPWYAITVTTGGTTGHA
jgi:ferredoxin